MSDNSTKTSASTSSGAAVSVTAVTYGCPDPAALSAFYRAAAGLTVVYDSAESVYLSDGSALRLGFDRVPDALRPTWSRDRVPAVRVDLATNDLAADRERLLELGATQPGHDADTDQWIFLADPAGNPVCLTSVY